MPSLTARPLRPSKKGNRTCARYNWRRFLVYNFTPSCRAIFSEHELKPICRSFRNVEKIIEVQTRHFAIKVWMNVAMLLQGSNSELAKFISIFLFRNLRGPYLAKINFRWVLLRSILLIYFWLYITNDHFVLSRISMLGRMKSD